MKLECTVKIKMAFKEEEINKEIYSKDKLSDFELTKSDVIEAIKHELGGEVELLDFNIEE